jgi:acyl carrier protein
MTPAEAQELLIRVVQTIQRLSGREEVDVTADTRPVTQMPGFDSLNGVEATMDISEELEIEFEFNDIFVDERKSLSIKEAADRLLAALQVNTKKRKKVGGRDVDGR